MANYKKQDHYYVCYPNGVRIEVSEEVYRVWAYGFNKEATARRKYFYRTHVDEQGNYISIPSRLIPLESEDINLLDTLADCTYEPQAVLERKEQLNLLMSALSLMPEQYRQILNLLYFEQMTEVTVAKMYSVTQSAIAGRKHRALLWLRQYFKANGITIQDFNMWL